MEIHVMSTAPVNFLSPINFKFSISRAPNVNFFIQKVNIPGVSSPGFDVGTPLLRIPYPADHLLYDNLEITFKIDENLQNYLEIFNWIKAIGGQDYTSYKDISSQPTYTGKGIRSDISLQVLTSKRNPNYEIIFIEAFPIEISSLVFDSSLEDISYLEATATFRYIQHNINKIT